jgi:hypothetical protein
MGSFFVGYLHCPNAVALHQGVRQAQRTFADHSAMD